MENIIFKKNISFDYKYYGFDPEIVLHFYFHSKKISNSDAQREREREREREKEEIIGTLPHIELHPLPHAKRSRSSPSHSSENFHSPQKISLLTHSHHSRQAQAEGQRELSSVKPKSSPRPTAPSV